MCSPKLLLMGIIPTLSRTWLFADYEKLSVICFINWTSKQSNEEIFIDVDYIKLQFIATRTLAELLWLFWSFVKLTPPGEKYYLFQPNIYHCPKYKRFVLFTFLPQCLLPVPGFPYLLLDQVADGKDK